MLHWIIFAERRPGISKLHFHRHWRDVHPPLFKKTPGIRRYVQNHLLEPPEGLPWDGIVDIYADSEEAMVKAFTCPEYRNNASLDEPNFTRGPRSQRMLSEDYVLLEGPPIYQNDILGKVIFPLRRKPGMKVEEFHRYWREVHAPLVLQLPRLRRYVQSQTIVSKPMQEAVGLPPGEPYFDGVEYLWFDSKSALREALESLVAFVDVKPDLANFVDVERFVTLVAEEFRSLWPEG